MDLLSRIMSGSGCSSQTACAVRQRGLCYASAKGFGTPTANRKKAGAGKKAADDALADARNRRPDVRPIDPKEAARGKVDYVQVKDWAGGKAPDIGDLQVVPGSHMGTGFAPGSQGSDATGAAVTAAAAANETEPFFKLLGQHVQYLERQGVLSIAEGPGRQPYLPFEAWKYTSSRYRQYLAELAAIHGALEAALSTALGGFGTAVQQASSGNSSSSSSSSPFWVQPGVPAQVVEAYSALAIFDSSSGLWRAAAAQADLAALTAAAAAAAADAAAEQPGSHAQQQQQLQSKKAGRGDVRASQNAVAYGSYMMRLAQAASAASSAAAAFSENSSNSSRSSRSSLTLEEAEGCAAALKLVAHVYAIQMQQCLLGSRIGAAATEQLQLLSVPAVALYMQYPQHVQEPADVLIELTDRAGQRMGAAGRQVVLDELPKALRKSALALSPLATA